MFKDYLYYDEITEYLKRFYTIIEINPRIKILTDFYKNSFKPQRPCFIITTCHKIINKRYQKLNKIYYEK